MEFEDIDTNRSSIVQKVELEEKETGDIAGETILGENLELVGDVVVSLEAILGHSEITIKELFSLRSGELIKLDRAANGLIDIFLDNKLVAQGELVSVDENFGIKVTRIIDSN